MIRIDHDRCTGCGACVEACPNEAIEMRDGFAQVLAERCTECGTCVEVCPQGAVFPLAEPAPATDTQERAIMEPEEQPTDRSQEIIRVQVPPPPTLAPPRPTLARQLGLAFGATLSFLGREVAPRVLRLAANWVEEQILSPQKPSSQAISRRSAPSGVRRRHRLRRGRR